MPSYVFGERPFYRFVNWTHIGINGSYLLINGTVCDASIMKHTDTQRSGHIRDYLERGGDHCLSVWLGVICRTLLIWSYLAFIVLIRFNLVLFWSDHDLTISPHRECVCLRVMPGVGIWGKMFQWPLQGSAWREAVSCHFVVENY